MSNTPIESFGTQLITIDPADPMVALGQGTVITYRDCPVHELIEAQVDAGPDRDAVECTGTTLSYLGVWQEAGNVREFLLSADLSPGSPVGVALGRNHVLIPALLGIWRAGGGYVPLDDQMPAQRLNRILEELGSHGMRWILVDHPSKAASLGVTPIHEIKFEGLKQSILACRLNVDRPGPDRGTSLAGLAYVMYTSGSTGQPKGTVITHRNVCAFLKGLDAAFGADADEVSIATTPLTFDISVLELFWPLSAGRRLVLLDSMSSAAPGVLGGVLRRPGPKLLQVTPSTAALVDFPEGPNQLRLLVGGEALPRQAAARLLRHCDSLVNLYGPTETTVWVTQHKVRDLTDDAVVPLGRPLPNCGLLVLDAEHSPVPIGLVGELYVYGPQVAAGYLNASTSLGAFFTDAKRAQPVYRTRDRVAWSADGTLCFLGRVDSQVKIAGNRVELGEIEAALRTHAEVHDAAAILDRDVSPPRVRAFVQPRNSENATSRAVEEALVGQWVRVFDEQHDALQDSNERGLPADIWRSSIDGAVIPRDQMSEWLDAVTDIVKGSRRILDIGCGTGSLLTAVEPSIDRYVGLEPSRAAVVYLKRFFSGVADKASFVHALAHSLRSHAMGSIIRGFGGWDGEFGQPDCIVLNSVVQYFPSISYLDEVLGLAFDLLAPGGRLLVTDVRNAALLHHLEKWRHVDRGDEVTTSRIAGNELCLDPRYFSAWASGQAQKPAVWVSPKFLQHRNELAIFRYDVEMTKATSPKRVTYELVPYSAISDGFEGLIRLFGQVPVAVMGIPDARLPILGASAPTTPVELRRLLAAVPGVRIGLDPFNPRQGALMVACLPTGNPNWGDIASVAKTADRLSTQPRLDASIHPLGDIWEHLTQHLPVHMLPVSVRLLPRLPLTSSGKVDRVWLATNPIDGVEIPQHQANRRNIDSPGKIRVGPQADILDRLVDLASDLLDTNLDPDDDLVQAGVTSLDAVRLAGRAWQRFGWNIGGGQILRLRTLREIAEHLAHGHQELGGHGQGPVRQVDITLAQRAMLALSYLEPSNTKMNILMRWQLDGTVDEARMRAAIGAVMSHYPALSTLYPAGTDPVVLDPADVHGLVVVRPDEGTEVTSPDRLMQSPFDLGRMPPVRWMLGRSGQASGCLYAVLHHVSVDDAALVTLHDALVNAYAGLPLPPKPSATQYSEVCATERRLLAERRPADRAFWRDLRGSFDEAIGFDKHNLLITPARARRKATTLPGGATMIQRVSRSMDVTEYSLFLAAASSTVARTLGGSSVLVGVPVSSREAVGGEGLLGCFANLVPLAIFDHGEDILRTIRGSHSSVLLGLDHGLMPFAEIAREAKLPCDDTGDSTPSFVCQLAPALQPAAARGVVFSPAMQQPVRAFYPLTARGETSNGDLAVYIDFDPGVIDDHLAQHLLQELVTTLERFSRLGL